MTPLINLPELGDENSLEISMYSLRVTFGGIDGKNKSSAIDVIRIA